MCTLISVVHLYAENDMMLRYKRAAATCPGYRCTPHCSILTDKLVVRKCCGGKKKKGKMKNSTRTRDVLIGRFYV